MKTSRKQQRVKMSATQPVTRRQVYDSQIGTLTDKNKRNSFTERYFLLNCKSKLGDCYV